MTRVVGFTTSAWKFAPVFCASVTDEWWASTAGAGKGRFRDGAFTPTFFGAEAADILVIFRPC